MGGYDLAIARKRESMCRAGTEAAVEVDKGRSSRPCSDPRAKPTKTCFRAQLQRTVQGRGSRT